MSEIKELSKQVEDFVTNILQNELPDGMVYHSLEHTLSVVRAAKKIGSHCQLSPEEMEMLELAAWFHDVGYKTTYTDHESESAKVAETFLINAGYPEDKAKRVHEAIMATRMPQSPQNKMEKALCDADLQHLGTDEYDKWAKLLLKEMNNFNDNPIQESQWMQMNMDFIAEHDYFTDYAQETLGKQKDKNRKKVKKKFKKVETPEIEGYLQQIKDLEKKLAKNKDKRPDRGIETMFRLTSKNHLDLSSMADNKANIMISVNSIILSIILTVLIRKLDELPHFLIPTVILMLVCLTTIVFAILATRPNVSHGKFTRDNIVNKETNLLFFGNFHAMRLHDYEWGMKQMMKDADYLYTSLIRDIYFLGVVLGKKYKMLRTSYTIFMFGFVLAVLSFVIAEAFFKPTIPF